MLCSTLTPSFTSPLVCSSVDALLGGQEVTHPHLKAGRFLKTPSFPPGSCAVPVPKQVLPPLSRHTGVTGKHSIDFSGPHIQF